MTPSTPPTADPTTPPDVDYIGEVAHPAARSGQGILTSRQTVLVVVVALVTAALLDSHALVRAGEGMKPGVTRSATLGAGRAIDRAATSLRLDAPRQAFDDALHRQDSGGGPIIGAAVPPPLPSPTVPPEGATTGTLLPSLGPTAKGPSPTPSASASAGAIQLRQPTRAKPLRVLVTGDSLSTYVGVQMEQLSHDVGLLDVMRVSADGTGLSNPSFYNWQKAAKLGVQAHHPEVVVMVIGGNDGWNMTGPSGDHLIVGTDAWVDEYARRVAAIISTYVNGGVSAVYWSGPPTARDPRWNGLYRKVNLAAQRAALAVPKAHYVDLFRGTAVDGRYADRVPYNGHTVTHSRQSDGVHWTLDGSLLPASLELAALSDDLGRKVG
jgi:lysophospholipase L1-like esterase